MCNDLQLYKLDSVTKATARPNGRKLRRLERGLVKGIKPEFEKHKLYILRKAKKLFNKKSVNDDIDAILDNLDIKPLVAVVMDSASRAMTVGGQYRVRKEKLSALGISFTLTNPLAVDYLETSRPLELAKLADTTKAKIKPILIKALKSGQSYNDTAKIIADSFAFSEVRAQMIAVNEIGRAYEVGNMIPMRELKAMGYEVRKQWSTVGDENVTPQCADNEAQGWIELDKPFESGDDTPPRINNPRCRCSCLWEYDS